MDIDIEISPALHPKNVESVVGYETNKSYLNPVLESLSEAYEGLRKTHQARIAASKNPTTNDAGKVLIVAQFAEKMQDAITKKIDRTMKDFNEGIASMESMLNEPLKSSAATGPIPTEIRTHIKSLSVSKRQQFLSDAEAAGDLETLGAVLGAPGFLSGMTEQERQVRTRMYHEARSPETSSRLATMRAGREMLTERSGLIFGEFERAMGVKWADVAEIKGAKNASDKLFAVTGV